MEKKIAKESQETVKIHVYNCNHHNSAQYNTQYVKHQYVIGGSNQDDKPFQNITKKIILKELNLDKKTAATNDEKCPEKLKLTNADPQEKIAEKVETIKVQNILNKNEEEGKDVTSSDFEGSYCKTENEKDHQNISKNETASKRENSSECNDLELVGTTEEKSSDSTKTKPPADKETISLVNSLKNSLKRNAPIEVEIIPSEVIKEPKKKEIKIQTTSSFSNVVATSYVHQNIEHQTIYNGPTRITYHHNYATDNCFKDKIKKRKKLEEENAIIKTNV